jgi:hypothetical protein
MVKTETKIELLVNDIENHEVADREAGRQAGRAWANSDGANVGLLRRMARMQSLSDEYGYGTIWYCPDEDQNVEATFFEGFVQGVGEVAGKPAEAAMSAGG